MDVDEPLKRLANPKNLVDRIERNARNGRAGASADALQGDEIFQSLGDQYAGRFISPSKESLSSEPTDSGFTGAFHSGDGEVFPEGNIIIGGVEAGVLNAGITDEGRLIINSVTLNGTELDAGLIRNEAGYITEQNVDNGSEDRTMRIGMIDNGTYAEGRIEFNEPSSSSVTVPNGDFATNDMTDWTVNAGTWDASAGYAVGTSSSSAPSIKNTTKIAVTAGNTYNFTGQFSASCLGTYGSATTFTVVTKLDVKFYTVADALVSTVTVGTRTGSQTYGTPAELSQGGASLGWGSITKNILVPATATKYEFVAYIDSFSGDSCTLSVDDFTCVQVAAQSALVFQDGKIIYEKSDGTEFEIKKSLEEVSIKTANQSISTTTPADVTDLLFTVAANTIYWLELATSITTTTGGASMDAQLSFTLPSGATIKWGSMAGVVSDMETVGPSGAPSVVSTGALRIGLNSNATSIFRFGAFITTSSTAGTVQLQARQDTSNAGTFQIDKASFIKYTDLSGANLASPAYYTDAEAQDAVGALLTDTATINLTYTANTSITADVIDGSITEAKMEMPTAASTSKVIGWTGTVLDWITLSASYISDFVAEVLSATSAVYAPIAKGVTNGDSHDHSGGDGAQISFLSLGGAPASYIASNMVQVNSAGTALELIALGAKIHSTTNKTLPVDADEIVLSNSAVSFASAARTTLTNFKAYLKTYNDTLYQPIGTYGDISGTGVVGQLAEFVTNTKTLQAAKIIAPPTHILTLTTTAASTLALNITAAKTLTLTAADSYTLTIPATGTAALLATANVFTAAQKINVNSTTAFFVEQDGVKDNVFIVDTTNGKVGVGAQPRANSYDPAFQVYSTSGTTNPAAAFTGNSTGTSYGSYFPNFVLINSTATVNNWAIFRFSPTAAGDYQSTAILTQFVDRTGANYAGNLHFFTRASGSDEGIRMSLTSTGDLGIGDGASTGVVPLAKLHVTKSTTTTNSVREVSRIEAIVSTASTGSANGFGAAQTFYAETATNATNQQQGQISTAWIDATNATRKASMSLYAYDTAARLGLTIEASGSAAKVSLYGATPVIRATTSGSASTFSANTSGIADDTATYDGFTIGQVVKALRDIGILT